MDDAAIGAEIGSSFAHAAATLDGRLTCFQYLPFQRSIADPKWLKFLAEAVNPIDQGVPGTDGIDAGQDFYFAAAGDAVRVSLIRHPLAVVAA